MSKHIPNGKQIPNRVAQMIKCKHNDRGLLVISIGFPRKPFLIDALVGLEFGVVVHSMNATSESYHHVLLLGGIPPFLLVLDNRAYCIADLWE